MLNLFVRYTFSKSKGNLTVIIHIGLRALSTIAHLCLKLVV